MADKYKDLSFAIFVAFILTFTIARLVVKYFPGLHLETHGTHIHHYTYGIILLAISGYIAIVTKGVVSRWVAIIFGAGLALAVDEAGIWLNLTNSYYNDTSEDALILVSALLFIAIYFLEFWIKLTHILVRRK